MAKNNLDEAKAAKFDEFYTQYSDIQKEVNAYLEFNPDVFRGKTILLPCDDPEWSNFTRFFVYNFKAFGLKKLISTSFAPESKKFKPSYQPTIFEANDPNFDPKKTIVNGKIFVLEDSPDSDTVSFEDLKWDYLEGDGDFSSEEVRALFREADIIVTNPPFSLFKEFLAQIFEFGKQFLIIGNKNSVTYKEVFPLFKDNKLWSGATEWAGGMWFKTMSSDDIDKVVDGINMKNVPSIWLTNLDHGRRHEPLRLMSMEDNLRYSKHQIIKANGYNNYDNYDAIEVPYTDSIPNGYQGAMGVPISFLEKYNPDQFEIIGATESEGVGFSNGLWHSNSGVAQATVNGKKVYKRIFIKFRRAL